MKMRRAQRGTGNVLEKTGSICSTTLLLKPVLRVFVFFVVFCRLPVLFATKPGKNNSAGGGDSRAHIVIMHGEGYFEPSEKKSDSKREEGAGLALGEVQAEGRFRISKGGYVKLILPGGCVLRVYGETRFHLKKGLERGACPKVKLTEGRVQLSATSSKTGSLQVKDTVVRVKGGTVRVGGVENRRICSLKGNVEVNIPISYSASSEENGNNEGGEGEDDENDEKKSDQNKSDDIKSSPAGDKKAGEKEPEIRESEKKETAEVAEPKDPAESAEPAEKVVKGRGHESVSQGSGDGKKWSLIPPGRCVTAKNELEDYNGGSWGEKQDYADISVPEITMDMEPVLPDRRKKGAKGGKEGGSDSIAASAGGSMCLDSSGSGSSAGNVQQGPSGIQKPPPKTILKIKVTIPGR